VRGGTIGRGPPVRWKRSGPLASARIVRRDTGPPSHTTACLAPQVAARTRRTGRWTWSPRPIPRRRSRVGVLRLRRPVDAALGYKNLLEAERSLRDLVGTLQVRPVFHRLEERIRAQILICCLSLLLVAGRKTPSQRHLAQHPPRTRTAPPRHPPGRRPPRQPDHRAHHPPTRDPPPAPGLTAAKAHQPRARRHLTHPANTRGHAHAKRHKPQTRINTAIHGRKRQPIRHQLRKSGVARELFAPFTHEHACHKPPTGSAASRNRSVLTAGWPRRSRIAGA
jgi:hypothetical protein